MYTRMLAKRDDVQHAPFFILIDNTLIQIKLCKLKSEEIMRRQVHKLASKTGLCLDFDL